MVKNPLQLSRLPLKQLQRLNIILANYLDVLPEIIGNQNVAVPTTSKDKTIPTEQEQQSSTIIV